MDYTSVAEIMALAVLLLSTIFQIRQAGTQVFVLRFFSIFNLIAAKLKLSTGKQPFYIFTTSMNEDESFSRLILSGYQWDYFAYHDESEIISMRKLYGNRQVHVRIYGDGAVHMHDELNYEFDPVGHLKMKPQVPSVDEISRVRIALTTE